jgi:hypothetical protein
VTPSAPPTLAERVALAGGEATAALDRVGKLEPGRGRLDLWGFLHRDAMVGRTSGGVGLDYARRISTRWSAFGRGWAGYDSVAPGRWGAELLGGVRLDF